jgi:hypothetical protein
MSSIKVKEVESKRWGGFFDLLMLEKVERLRRGMRGLISVEGLKRTTASHRFSHRELSTRLFPLNFPLVFRLFQLSISCFLVFFSN